MIFFLFCLHFTSLHQKDCNQESSSPPPTGTLLKKFSFKTQTQTQSTHSQSSAAAAAAKRASLNYVIDVDNIRNAFKQQPKAEHETRSSSENQPYFAASRPKSVALDHGIESATSSSTSQHAVAANIIAQNSTKCYMCDKKVYLMERQSVMDFFLHVNCFRCSYCARNLRHGFYTHLKDPVTLKCKQIR